MSESNVELPDPSEQLDQMEPHRSLVDRGLDDPLEEGYVTADGWSPVERYGETETLDQRLAEEVPDDNVVEDEDEDFLDDGEVGDERAGRLVDPHDTSAGDDDLQSYSNDIGVDGAGASAEEAAVHVVPDGY
jgi:hypothetical protein